MHKAQPGILEPPAPRARYLTFSLYDATHARACLQTLSGVVDGRNTVIGIGASLALALGASVSGLRTFPSTTGAGVAVPSTPYALWCWLKGDDDGALLHRARHLVALVQPALRLEQTIAAFTYESGRDLTGYQDGTENPQGKAASAAAIVGEGPDTLIGSSYVAVQQWLHDLDRFERMSTIEQDDTIGRRRSDNAELENAPATAHIKRTAQESFTPPAFILRRSMPWAEGAAAGLMFVAFGKSFTAYEILLGRMVGHDDGMTDALFKFTRPISGAYYWCPPLHNGVLDWRLLGV